MTPKPFGYYGLNFQAEVERTTDDLQMHELTDLLNDITADLNYTHYLDNDEIIGIARQIKQSTCFFLDLSDVEKVAAIRALCDRIEAKLLEAAK